MLTFTWSAIDEVLFDETPPRLEQIFLRDGQIEILFSEEPDLASAGAALQIDGQSVDWSIEEDRYTLKTAVPLELGSHQLDAATSPLDLEGLGLAEPFELTFEIHEVAEECPPDSICATPSAPAVLFEVPDQREISTSAAGNDFGFHGLPHDPETGFVYMRNRYYDPELGRFISADPLGYVDGPSLYGFAGNTPYNSTDSMGLEQLTRAEREVFEKAREAQRIHRERRKAACRANPMAIDCQGLIARSLIRRFGDDSGSNRPTVRATVGPAGANPVLFVNGILNEIPNAEFYAEQIARWLNRPVTPIWNPTQSEIEDVLQTALVNKLNLPDETTRLVVETIRDRLAALGPDESLTLVGHSQGAAIGTSSLSLLTQSERSRIDFISIGGASCTFPAGLQSLTVYINTRDVVPMVVGAGAPGCKKLASSYPSVAVHYSSFGDLLDFENTHGVDDYRLRGLATDAATASGAELNRRAIVVRGAIQGTLTRLASRWFW